MGIERTLLRGTQPFKTPKPSIKLFQTPHKKSILLINRFPFQLKQTKISLTDCSYALQSSGPFHTFHFQLHYFSFKCRRHWWISVLHQYRQKLFQLQVCVWSYAGELVDPPVVSMSFYTVCNCTASPLKRKHFII